MSEFSYLRNEIGSLLLEHHFIFVVGKKSENKKYWRCITNYYSTMIVTEDDLPIGKL